jgi:protein-serine/threonine kinase
MNESVSEKDFRRIKFLGDGSMGDVYLVNKRGTKELYAMKVINKDKIVSGKKLQRIRTEREILSKINHPFIVSMHYDWADSEAIYFVLDYCAGGEFFKVLQAMPGRRLPEDHVRFYCAEILLALEFLHLMGYIHRDLKPENVLLHGSGHIMLADFDLAKEADEPTIVEVVQSMFRIKYLNPDVKIHSKPIISADSFVGTYEYLAPEIFSGSRYSDAVDWWAFGVLIYEMITGLSPFYGKSREETKENIVSGKLLFPSDIEISTDAKKIIKMLLKKDPKARLGSEHGASDIKEHPFFGEKINWGLLRNMTPPIIPDLLNIDE